MRKVLLTLFLFSLLHGKSHAISTTDDSCSSVTRTLSARYVNYNCSTPNDSVIEICEKIINYSSLHEDCIGKFKAEQLKVNALCQKGEIDQGIRIAREMYQEAKRLNHIEGKALALQAIGVTYMNAGQYQQALAAFSEAHPFIFSNGDKILQANLTIQQLHSCIQLVDTVCANLHLSTLKRLIPEISPDLKEIYLFYTTCYETLFLLKTGQLEKAQQNVQELSLLMPDDESMNIWRYITKAEFYCATRQNNQAINYLDSTIQIIRSNGHIGEYKNSICKQAGLLEAIGNYQEACYKYAQADSLTNIMDMERYTKDIENLHLTYYVDQAAIENTQMHNKLLANILVCSIIGIIVAVLLFIKARKRNKQLALSREKLNEIRQLTADSIQSKSIFLSNMSHDLRTPLNAIVGFSSILTTAEDIDSELKQQCHDYIRQNSDLLMKLVNDIVNFSTLKEAKIKFDFNKYDIVPLCRNVINTIANIKQTEAEIRFSSSIEKLEIETDSERLQQVLINLLTNATKFTKTGYIELHLDFNFRTNEAVFTVEDTGCGIPLEKQMRIFQRFEKLHESIQGVGLGLSICKLIIDRFCGKIWIDSAYTQGTRFIFTHPIIRTNKQQSV